MNMYLDFEATQFGENVLAIGAHSIYGEFDCLVKPPKGDKLTPFITQLTGITKEMLECASSQEEAFYDFREWVNEIASYCKEPIFFHVYGNCDAEYLRHSANKIENQEIREFVENLAESLIDDSKKVCKYFHAHSMGVHMALKYFDPDIEDQSHDPLDDAYMLARLMNYLEYAEPIKECPYQELAKEAKNKKSPAGSAPKGAFKLAPGQVIFGYSIQHPDGKPKTFYTAEAVIEWAQHRAKKRSPGANMDRARDKMIEAIRKGNNHYGRRWEIKEVN